MYRVINKLSAFYNMVGKFVRTSSIGYGEDTIIEIDGKEYAFFLYELESV